MTHETSGLLDVLDVWAPPRVRVLEAMSYGIPAVLRTHPVYGYAPLAYVIITYTRHPVELVATSCVRALGVMSWTTHPVDQIMDPWIRCL